MANQRAKAKDVIWRQIGDEVVVIRDDGLSVHVLNKTAAHIWKMCHEGHSPAEIAANLCQRFDVSLDVASADVRDLLLRLEEKDLLELTEVTKQ
jgi:hypothetical protein